MSRQPIQVQIPTLLERQPPVAAQAEAAVLGSMLLDPGCLPDVAAVLTTDAFYIEANRAVFDGLLKLGDKHGSADVMLLAQQLQDEGKLDAVGGPDYLIQLANGVPSSANAAHYAGIVAEKYRLRRLITAAGEILHNVYENNQATGDDAKAVIDHAESVIFAASEGGTAGAREVRTLGDLVRTEYLEMSRREVEEMPAMGIQTGFDELDDRLGGMQPGEFLIVAARPSMGKTAFAQTVAVTIARGGLRQPGTPVLFFSAEMSGQKVAGRHIAAGARIPSNRYRRRKIEEHEWQKLLAACDDVKDLPLYIDDTPNISIAHLRARARRMVRQHKVGLIIIDYLQLLTPPQGKGDMNPNQQVTIISRGIKTLARELNVPIIALSQLTRDCERRDNKRPMLSDLRDSGSLEQDADAVIFLFREEYYHKDDDDWKARYPEKLGLAEAIVAKARDGETGKVKLRFIPEETRFDAWSPNTEGGAVVFD